jgi:hypothetical protein
MSVIFGDHLPKEKLFGNIFRTTVTGLGLQMRNIGFIETSFVGGTDFTFVRYLATNNGSTEQQ